MQARSPIIVVLWLWLQNLAEYGFQGAADHWKDDFLVTTFFGTTLRIILYNLVSLASNLTLA